MSEERDGWELVNLLIHSQDPSQTDSMVIVMSYPLKENESERCFAHTCGNRRVHGGSLPGVDLLPGEAISPQRHAVSAITVVLFKRTAACRNHTREKGRRWHMST